MHRLNFKGLKGQDGNRLYQGKFKIEISIPLRNLALNNLIGQQNQIIN